VKELVAEIERVTPDGGDWCSVEKSQTLAALILGLRPEVVIEIGVWRGGSCIPMCLALRHVGGPSRMIAIDPWSPDASVVDQGETNARWWGATDHEDAYRAFVARLERHGITICTIERRSSDLVTPIACQMIHIDGNHGPQAARDVERFAPLIAPGGILILDDIGWEGGHVQRGREIAQGLGFVDLYPLGSGVVMQRR